jgi:hypothetical protein
VLALGTVVLVVGVLAAGNGSKCGWVGLGMELGTNNGFILW